VSEIFAAPRSGRGGKELDPWGLSARYSPLVYADVGQRTNQLTDAVYSLGELLEAPAALLLDLVSSTGQVQVDSSSFYVVALTAAAGYFILYLLLGVGRRG
jgi:hypothetical protein